MATFDELTQRVAREARLFPVTRGSRWLRAVVSLLADWGGGSARQILAAALPAEALRGSGSSGRTWDKALAEAGAVGETAVLGAELARRADEPDPTKVGLTAEVVLRAVKELLGEDATEKVADALPGVVGDTLRQASKGPPWAFRLIPQSYARPKRVGPGSGH